MSSHWQYPNRCPWCGRLRCYFGMGSLPDGRHLCQRCLMWCRRNRCFQIRDELCSSGSGKNEGVWLLVIGHNRDVWKHVVTMLCGSIQEEDMRIQAEIWRRVLLGTLVRHNERYMTWSVPGGVSIFWKFWMLDVWSRRGQALIPRYNDRCKNNRVLCIIIAFLGPFSEFGLADGYRWHRGWCYR